jgi:hypothetical protein
LTQAENFDRLLAWRVELLEAEEAAPSAGIQVRLADNLRRLLEALCKATSTASSLVVALNQSRSSITPEHQHSAEQVNERFGQLQRVLKSLAGRSFRPDWEPFTLKARYTELILAAHKLEETITILEQQRKTCDG